MDPIMTLCINCGVKSKDDVCHACLAKMQDFNVRKNISSLRHSEYSTDHGQVETKILSDFIVNDNKVLEIGCGAGHLSDYLFEQGVNIISIDFSNYMIEGIKKSYPYLTPIQMSAEILAFKNNTFDLVVSYELIEHLYEVEAHFKEVKRVLKTGGIYLIKTPNRQLDKLYTILDSIDKKYRKAFHPSLQSHSNLKNKLQKLGFDVKFLSIRQLSTTQKNKLKNKKAVALTSNLMKYLPIRFLPSILCVATKSGS
jgi:2-polyprenyl-3-methyl-5-hydroxy-6-metoxy-1,4-benzoquinol methylase